MAQELVRMERISKFYGRVRALEDVTLTVNESEIVGLLGDNGAGKSTLIKVLSGAVPATSGDIFVRGRKVEIRSTTDAIRQGIETIYQDSALVIRHARSYRSVRGYGKLERSRILGAAQHAMMRC